jgi:iron transport multicopper oxidase
MALPLYVYKPPSRVNARVTFFDFHYAGHIEWHLESGLAFQLITAPLLIQERAQDRVPSFMYEQCAALGTPSSGNAAGHASATDLSGLPLGPWLQKLGWLPKGILALTG